MHPGNSFYEHGHDECYTPADIVNSLYWGILSYVRDANVPFFVDSFLGNGSV